MTEIEVKIEIADLKSIRKKLIELGWELKEKQFQRTYRCWRPDRQNSKDGIFPRTRMTENLITGEKKSRLTVKWKTKDKTDNFFVRNEVETDVADAKVCAKILSVLGMSYQRILEKKREAWTQGDWKTIITIDKLPFGTFMEIEGTKKKIEKLIKSLGLENNRRHAVAYWDVYTTYCEEGDIKERKNLVFEKTT
jgi:adenylate cyclase class 2